MSHGTSIKVYVKDGGSSASSSIDSDIERGGPRMVKRHSEPSVNPFVRLNPIDEIKPLAPPRRNSSFSNIHTERPPSAEETAASSSSARQRDVPWGSRDPTDTSERFRRRSSKAATPESSLPASIPPSITNRRVSIRVQRDSVVEIEGPERTAVVHFGRRSSVGPPGKPVKPEPFGGQHL